MGSGTLWKTAVSKHSLSLHLQMQVASCVCTKFTVIHLVVVEIFQSGPQWYTNLKLRQQPTFGEDNLILLKPTFTHTLAWTKRASQCKQNQE